MTAFSPVRVSALALTVAAGLALAACKQEAKLEPGTFNLVCAGVPTTLIVNADNTATITVGAEEIALLHTGPGVRYETPADAVTVVAYSEVGEKTMLQQGDAAAVDCVKAVDAPVAATDETVVTETAVEETAAPEATEEVVTEEEVVEEAAPAAEAPVEDAPAETAPAAETETAPAEEAVTEETVIEETVTEETVTEETAPASEDAPAEDTTAPAGQ